jgi:hypothetical protein
LCPIAYPENWTWAADVPTTEDGWGALVIDPDCCTLHVLWHAKDGGPEVKVFYQKFDVCSGLFLGTPTQISPLGDLIDNYVSDIEVTAKGQVVAAYIRSSPWAVWIVELPGGTPLQVNTDILGWGLNMQAVHEIVHMSFRTNTGAYGIRYRAYDTCSDTFCSPTDLQVRTATSNVSHIAADGCGGIYVMSAGAGQIQVDYDPNPGKTFAGTSLLTIADAPLAPGNITYTHYALCAGPGNKIYAVWSPASGSYTTIHYQEFDNGAPIGGNVQMGGTAPTDSFPVIAGFRSTQSASGIVALLGNRNPPPPFTGGSEVAFGEHNPPSGLPTGRRTAKYGKPCECTTCPDPAPELDAWTLPNAAPLSFSVKVTNIPPTNSAILMIGTVPLHFPLSFLGIPCSLHTDSFLNVPMVPDPKGLAASLFGGAIPQCIRVQLQAVLLAPSCNSLGIVLTNGLTAVFM